MANKTWARLETGAVLLNGVVQSGAIAEIVSLPDTLVPGRDVFAASLLFADITAVPGIADGWTCANGTWSAPAAVAPAQADLVADANAKQAALRDGGITVNVGSASTPVEANVASDVIGRGLVTGCVQLIGVAQNAGQAAPTFPWINNDGTQLTLTAPQMMTIALDLGNFIQATYAALGTVLAAIGAGSITTTAQIDSAAWPATSY